MPDPNFLVTLLLLRFSELSASSQASFLDGLNQYLFASPQLRRALRRQWKDRCSDGEAGQEASPARGTTKQNASQHDS
ncbi:MULTISPECIES: hypothetical protein [Stenotrophomonas]|uniref:hypothetical protein n=1 Tax=Stenotrophomonas TaxID=40323 RepID=UPI002091B7CC|nr:MULTISPECIES: hypothetical protein [Stenotrophomonas maltophilia group]MCO5736198.1 hypothetical protein [Stenotrophomonas maltophilia]MCU1039231.1 hypothetical protein [Stenotrophomonas maltophilia]